MAKREPRYLDEYPYGLKLKQGQRQKLEDIHDKSGVPVPEQIRRGIDLWLKQQEAGR